MKRSVIVAVFGGRVNRRESAIRIFPEMRCRSGVSPFD
jgi:hypothetical protein